MASGEISDSVPIEHGTIRSSTTRCCTSLLGLPSLAPPHPGLIEARNVQDLPAQMNDAYGQENKSPVRSGFEMSRAVLPRGVLMSA